MRIWSLHPSYLDTKGLVAVWREGLLALHVFLGKTKGYTKHPQLQRFQEHLTPVAAISDYLHSIADEADRRNYHFNRQKLDALQSVDKIVLTRGQLEFEAKHLLEKLRIRDRERFKQLEQVVSITIHPLFELTDGPVALWEKI